jgi:hypothetical protein
MPRTHLCIRVNWRSSRPPSSTGNSSSKACFCGSFFGSRRIESQA